MLPDIAGTAPGTGGRPAAFIGCDTAYAVEHAVPLLTSLDCNSPGMAAHLHLVNPGAGLETALAALAADLADTTLTLTWERADLSSLDAESRATYYSAIRFVRAAEVMRAAARPILVLDADSLVRKPIEIPQTCEAGLFLRPDHPPHMRIAAGAVLFTPAGAAFAETAAAMIAKALDGGRGLRWYLDQAALAAAYERTKPKLHRFDETFLDWEFRQGTVLWTGKGPRKHESPAYVAERRRRAERFRIDGIRERFWGAGPGLPPRTGGGRRALILAPVLGLPFKRPAGLVREGLPIPLREHWASFAENAHDVLCEAGWNARILRRPMWELTPALADAYGADVVLVPHRERHQFASRTPALFWMQSPLPHLFTVDRQGWGAGASGYPFEGQGEESGAFASLAECSDANQSKFDQPPRQSREALGLPAKYIFCPCQIPHDETLRFHSDVGMAELVQALAEWAQKSGTNVVFKPHPANRAAMSPLHEAAPEGEHVHWIDASIHDLIAHSTAVYTVNSGVGLEAILHGKPVVTFGRADYDAVTVKGETGELSHLWRIVNSDQLAGIRAEAYRRFADWYVNRHAFDAAKLDAARLVALVEGAMKKTAKAA